MMFHNKLFFNLVNDLFKWLEDLWRIFIVRMESEIKIFLTCLVYEKKQSTGCQIPSSKALQIVFQTKLFFNIVKDFIN